MKNRIVIIVAAALMILTSCGSSKINDAQAFEIDNAWYWLSEYEDGTTAAEMESHVSTFANPNQTSIFLFYPKGTVPEVDLNSLSEVVLFVDQQLPTHGFYKLPNDPAVYNDAAEFIQLSK